MTGESLQTLFSNLTEKNFLTSLTIQREEFDYLSTQYLIELLYERKTSRRLKKFELSFCKIALTDFTKIAEALSDNRALQVINIQWNSFTSSILKDDVPPGAVKLRMPRIKKKKKEEDS